LFKKSGEVLGEGKLLGKARPAVSVIASTGIKMSKCQKQKIK